MNKLIKTFIAGLLLVASVNAMAWLIHPYGTGVWRDGQSDPGDAAYIAYEFMNDQAVYGHLTKGRLLVDGDDASMLDRLCDKEENSLGKKLFDPIFDGVNLCLDKEKAKGYINYPMTMAQKFATRNYYGIIIPISSGLPDRFIGEVQMGSTVNRTPPKFIRVIVPWDQQTDQCHNNGDYTFSIECNGWSYKSVMKYWNVDVPPEIKALNGTGVKAKATEPVSTTQ